jgi:putative FmdB family regulatory protein
LTREKERASLKAFAESIGSLQMPFFDYSCRSCDHTFEVLQKSGEAPPATCPACGQDKLEKLVSAPAIQSSSGGSGHVHGPGCRH